MEELIGSHLEKIQIGELRTFGNMGISPLSFKDVEGPEYLTLSQGFAQETLVVEEITESGSVPELSVTNRGKIHVLLLDGEEIRGAKQNRVLNTSILVAPGSKCTIPVSCTEQGRWNYTSKRFEDSGYVMAQSLRLGKQASVSRNIRENRSYRSDQGAVWESVQNMHRNLNTSSATGAMRDAYEAKQEELEEYASAFADLGEINGIAVYLAGKLVGVDLLSHVPAMTDLCPKLIGSYAVDAIRMKVRENCPVPNPAQVRQFISQIGRCVLEAHKSQGIGDDARLEGDDIQGAGLIALDTLIHLAAFSKVRASSFEGGMSSFSRRRRYRTS